MLRCPLRRLPKLQNAENKITMKKIIFAILSLIALPILAQSDYVSIPTTGYMPATQATTVVTNLANPPVIDCSRQQNVSIQFSFNQSAASTSNVVFTLQKSIDRLTWDTNQVYTISIPSTGTARVDAITNLNVGGARYLRVSRIANDTALTTMTNFGIQYSIKVNSP